MPGEIQGGSENPTWDKKQYDSKPQKSSVKIPYFRIQIGRRSDELNESIRKGGILANTAFQKKIGDMIERFVTKITIVETMEGPDRFSVDIVDPDMTVMFSEHLYIGRPCFIDIGYWQGDSFKFKNAAEGYINKMDYKFTRDGLPKLTFKGFGLIWDILSKDDVPFAVTFDKNADSSPVYGPLRPLHQRCYKDIPHMLDAIAKEFNLKVIFGKTVPSDLMEYIQKDFEKAKNLNPNNEDGVSNWNSYLRSLAKATGCQYFQKGRYLHFFPAAWLNAPIKRKSDMERSITELKEARKKLPAGDSKIKQYNTVIKTKEEELKKWDVQMENVTTGGLFELNYMMGSRNLLKFSPTLTDINTAGYMAMAMDPTTGDVSFGKQIAVGNEAGKIAKMNVGAKLNAESDVGVNFDAKKQVVKPEDIGQGLLNTGGGISAKRDTGAMVIKKRNVGPKGPMDNKEASAAAQASFLNWMWFSEARATCLGNVNLTCAMPVWVRGLGPRKHDGDKETTEYDSGKLCGKWYVFEVKHELTPSKEYTCDLVMKRFWNYIKDFDNQTTSEQQDFEAEKKKWIAAQGQGGNSAPSSTISVPKSQPPSSLPTYR